MKKAYRKPSIYIESFEMNTAICSCGAGSGAFWGGRPNHGDPNTCEYRDYTDVVDDQGQTGLVVAFTEMNQDCRESGAIIPSDGDGSIYCYQALDESMMVFAS